MSDLTNSVLTVADLRVSDLRVSDVRVSGTRVDEITPDGGRASLVRDVSLQVRRGEVVALVGESGSGKSLTGKAILGLLPEGLHASGSVLLGAEQVIGTDDRTLRELRGTAAAMVFQEPQSALNPSRRVGQQIVAALRAHRRISRRDARELAVELLSAVGIPDPDKRVYWYPHRLSGGQKQRVVIAIALAGEPDLLIADEPTTALDVTVQAEILDLFEKLRTERGLGILLITHNLGIVAHRADRVVVMRNGEFVEAGSVAEVFAAPRHEYTRKLLAAVPVLQTEGATGVVEESAGRPLLEVRDLTVTFPGASGEPDFDALRSVSLALRAGQVLGVVGESGSGKSTLGRAVLGLVKPTAGEVELNTDRVAFVHQDPYASLDPRWSIERTITEPIRIRGDVRGAELRTRARELLDAVRLPAEIAGRRPRELSGGQRQRIALARALAAEPDIIVADEPTSALDVSVQADVLELFADLQARLGFAALFITHDLAVISEVADRVAVFRQGQLVESGPVAEIFGAPATAYTRELLAAVPDLARGKGESP